MKLGYFLALPMAMAFSFTHVTKAADRDDKVEIKEKDKHGEHEWRMKVKRKDNGYVGYYNDREFTLRGDASRHIDREGEYVIHGDMAPDSTYVDTTEIRPYVVEEHVRTEERPVIIEKERRDPLIKLPGVEIRP